MSKKIYNIILILLVVGLSAFILYDKVIKKTETKFEIDKGTEIAVMYNQNEIYVVDNTEDLMISYKKMTDEKIKKAKVISGIFSSDEAESAVVIMENGSVYIATASEKLNNLQFNQEERLKDYKISDIISANTNLGCGPNVEGCGTTYKVILFDGSKKTIHIDPKND